MVSIILFCLFHSLLLFQTAETTTTFQEYNLKAHNVLRELHGVPELQLDEGMSKKAEWFANMMAKRGRGVPEHSTGQVRAYTGENLSVQCHDPDDPFGDLTFPTQRWYKEFCNYGYDFKMGRRNPYLASTSRFTQMIWKNSRKFGIGKAYGNVKHGSKLLHCKYIVAWYQPAGNIAGQYRNNVFAPSSHKHECNKIPLMLIDSNFDIEKDVKHTIMNNSIFSSDTMESDTNNKNGGSSKEQTNENNQGKEEGSTNGEDRSSDNAFEEFHLEAHNKYRKVHEAPPLTLNSQMSREATEWAKELAETWKLEHSKTGQGENLAMSCRSADDIKDDFTTRNWYDEVCKPGYNFEREQMNGGTGHFTQVVWKDSKELGIGKAVNWKNGIVCTFVVARYSPAGNYMGKFKQNVFEGSFSRKKDCEQSSQINEKNTQNDKTKDKNQNNAEKEKDLTNTEDNDRGNSFEEFHLEAHNKYRKIHEAPPLTLNSQMSREAKEWAKKLAEEGSTLKHSKTDQGENLALSCTYKDIKDDFATRNWYNEVCKPGYNFEREQMSRGTFYFTQVVWKDSKEFGIGKAFVKLRGLNCIYVVARYSPPGNYLGKFKENVFKGSFSREVCSKLKK